MGRRFPVTTPDEGGDPGGGGSAPWLAVKPAPGAAYGTGGSNGHYTIADANVRGGDTAASFCMVHLAMEPTVKGSSQIRTMWDCVLGSNGHRMTQIESAGPQVGRHSCTVGSTQVDAEAH